MQIEVVESVTKTIGSLALAYPYLRQLGVAEIIDTLATKGKERRVSTGQVIEILVLNRLSLRPTPISRIDVWAKSQAVEEVYGLAAEALNDDRIGRALDEIHPHLVDAWAALVLRGAQRYGIHLGQLHSDVTRLAFEGSYDQVPAQTVNGQPVAKITYGFTGKEDPSRKQLTLSLSVVADGGMPAWYRLADGNAADTRAYLAHLTAVRERLQLDKPLVVGDSKLITHTNMLGFCRVGARFIGPTSLRRSDRLSLRRLWEAGDPLHRLDEAAAGQEPSVGRYWGWEQREVLPDPEQATQYALRRLFVQSLDDRKAARHQRAKDLLRARRALWSIKGRLSRPAYRQLTFVQRKVAEAVAKVKQYVETEVIESSDGLDVRWRLQRECLREDAQFDGFYCILTNEVETRASLQAIFLTYKEQSKVERRFRLVKQPPIQVRPVWLHQPQRIESLVFVVMVALFVFALIEREARRVVKESGQVLTGLHPEGRDKLPVTAGRLFEAFAPLSLVKQRLRVAGEVIDVLTPATLNPTQAQVLDRLGLMKPVSYLQPTITPNPT
jgi:transposase